MKKVICTIILTSLLSACSSVPSLSDIAKLSPFYKANQVKSIAVYVAPDDTLRYAISIDVVFVYSEAVLTMVNGMNATDWFSKKAGLTSGFGNQLEVLEWQMVAGYADDQTKLPSNHASALAVIAFAYYPDNPNAMVVLTEMETPWILFSDGNLTAVSQAPTSSSD